MEVGLDTVFVEAICSVFLAALRSAMREERRGAVDMDGSKSVYCRIRRQLYCLPIHLINFFNEKERLLFRFFIVFITPEEPYSAGQSLGHQYEAIGEGQEEKATHNHEMAAIHHWIGHLHPAQVASDLPLLQ